MRQLPLFVYGTLKPGASNYRTYLSGCILTELPATIDEAVLYNLGECPTLVIGAGLARPDEQVHGILITLRPRLYDQTLRHIDSLEEYVCGNPWNWYERIIHPVRTGNALVDAWVYVAGSQVFNQVRVGRYRKVTGGNWRIC